MENQTITAFAEKRRTAGIPGLIHTGQKPQDKLRLSLRKTPFNLELERMGLPDEVKGLLAKLFEQREKSLASQYDIVFVYNKLKRCGSFWLDYNFSSRDDFLSHFGLPNGNTLGKWEVLIELFEKDTYVLLGDEVLSAMTREVSCYQEDSDERKKDYHQIFKDYTSQYSVFDVTNFYRVMNFHIHRRYIIPRTSVRTTDVDVHKKPKKTEPVGVVRIRKLGNASKEQSITPRLEKDFVVETVQCGGCKKRDQTITQQEIDKSLAAKYILALEQIVVSKLGEDALPKKGRPKFVENYEK